LDNLDRELTKIPLACKAEKRTGVKKVYLALGGFATLFLMLFMNWAGSLITNLVGFVYPAYMSVHAVESPDKSDDTQWLIYWIVFAFFSIIEYFSYTVLYYFPFYYIVKLVLLMWLFLPNTKGALVVYNKAVKPLVTQVDSKMTPKDRPVNTFQADARKDM